MLHFPGIWSKISFQYYKIPHHFFMYFFILLTTNCPSLIKFPRNEIPRFHTFPGMVKVLQKIYKITLTFSPCGLPHDLAGRCATCGWFKLESPDICTLIVPSKGLCFSVSKSGGVCQTVIAIQCMYHLKLFKCFKV